MCRLQYRVAAASAPLSGERGEPEKTSRRAPEAGLDWLLRFQGNPSATGELECAFEEYRTRALRGHRSALISLLAAANAAALVAGVAQAFRSGVPDAGLLGAGYLVHCCLCVLCLALALAVRAVPPRATAVPLRWIMSHAAELGAAACVFGVDPSGRAPDVCSNTQLQFSGLLLFVGMPLACAVAFAPRWRVYAAICLLHAARAFYELGALGLLPAVFVCLASVIGAAGVYCLERILREHYVRAAAFGCLGTIVRAHPLVGISTGNLHSLTARTLACSSQYTRCSFRLIISRSPSDTSVRRRTAALLTRPRLMRARALPHAGHEIRNPLHGVGAGVEACLSGDLTPAELRTELAAVLDGVRMIAMITNDLLDLQKMRAGGFSVNLAAASPAALVEACVRCVQPAVAVPIEVAVDASVPLMVCASAGMQLLLEIFLPYAGDDGCDAGTSDYYERPHERDKILERARERAYPRRREHDEHHAGGIALLYRNFCDCRWYGAAAARRPSVPTY